MSTTNILIVEDEENIAEVLIAYCHLEGYNAKHLNSGQGVVDYVRNNSVDLILLDIMLPQTDGMTLCQAIRRFSNVAIIMVSAKRQEIDKLQGFKFGADDYICKPFSPKEVMVRISAVLRRTQTTHPTCIECIDFVLYLESYLAMYQSQPLPLTAVEFKILSLLIGQEGRVFSREEIIHHAYQDAVDISDRNIDTHIKNIRKKIHQVDNQINPIVSVYGVGYKFAYRLDE
ncbi:response regulator [Marinomonas sp.]